MNRGDIAIVPSPLQLRPDAKIRSAVSVQSDAENGRLANTVLAMIRGILDHAGQTTSVLVDPGTSDGVGQG